MNISKINLGKHKIVTVVGARPQFIKAAPVSAAFRNNGINEVVIHTGQHFDENMSELFFRELNMSAPDYNLAIHSLNHGAMTGRMLEAIESILTKEKPALLLVYGDTNSTLAGALAAVKVHIPVAHIEAGLRSFNKSMPEEINRIMTDHISDLLFCPTQTAVQNLASENISNGVMHAGDVMMDATLNAIKLAKNESKILDRLNIKPKTYALCTLHRAENTDDQKQFSDIMDWLEQQSKDLPIIMPAHPRTRKILDATRYLPDNLHIVEPIGYLDMTWLLYNAKIVFTDSGGLQKEAFFHRVECVTLREETEWVETIDAGWNRLWRVPTYNSKQNIEDYGDGHASEKIAVCIKEYLQ